MSEHIKNQARRQAVLKRLIRELHEGKSVEEVKGEFRALLQDVGGAEIAAIEQTLIAEGLPETEVKRLCDVHVAVFRESLDSQARPETLPGHPVHTFLAENKAAERALDALQEALDALHAEPGRERLQQASARLDALREYEKHYLRKENILFPYLEQKGFAGPSTVMWAIHDDIRVGWKALDELLNGDPGDLDTFYTRVDEAFESFNTAIREMFFKEENILFPTAIEKLNEDEWRAIREQEAELGYSDVLPGEQWPIREFVRDIPLLPVDAADQGLLQLDTGALTLPELNRILGHLPVEISYVDAEDTVQFFTQTAERLFPRSPAIIGRKVQKCHPPASVHRVQRILDDFRARRRDEAEFWIQMKGRFIHIRYFALRDEAGAYQGTLEVAQDVTRIRALQGEKRLLDEGV
jgi:DUF438 domain-containing protein